MGGGNTASKLRAGCVPRMRRDKKDMPEGEKHTWRKHGMLISGSSTGKILGSIPKNCWISWRRYPRR